MQVANAGDRAALLPELATSCQLSGREALILVSQAMFAVAFAQAGCQAGLAGLHSNTHVSVCYAEQSNVPAGPLPLQPPC